MRVKSFEEQCEIYRKQQTVSGKRKQKCLDHMSDSLKDIGVHVKSGTLTPLVNHSTGEVTSFLER